MQHWLLLRECLAEVKGQRVFHEVHVLLGNAFVEAQQILRDVLTLLGILALVKATGRESVHDLVGVNTERRKHHCRHE